MLARLTVAAVLLASAVVAFLSAVNTRAVASMVEVSVPPQSMRLDSIDYGRGDHYLWWLIWLEVRKTNEHKVDLGSERWGQVLMDAALVEVKAGHADQRLTALVRMGQ